MLHLVQMSMTRCVVWDDWRWGMANPRVMKNCSGCGVEAEHYTQRKGERFVPLSRCVVCEKARKKAHAKANPEKRRARDQRYERSAKGRKARAAWKRTEAGRAKSKRQSRRRKVDPQQSRARAAVHRAVMDRQLVPPERCGRCGGRPTPHGGNARGLVAHHHAGYARENWLNVEWVCVPCHKREHGAYQGHEPDTSTWVTWERRAARDRTVRRAKIKAATAAYQAERAERER